MEVKSFISALFVVFIFACDVQAGIVGGVYHNDSHPGKCYLNENLILSPGEIVRNPDYCGEFLCGEKSLGSVDSCVYGKISNCEYGGLIDEHADYPLCCARRATCPGHPEDEAKEYEHWKTKAEKHSIGSVPRRAD